MEHLSISPTPLNEPCVQVGSDLYSKHSRKEARAFKNQCQRTLDNKFGFPQTEDDGSFCTLRIKSNPHDFGSYLDVEAEYDPDNESSVNQAYWLESNTPEHWDDEAKEELGPEYFLDLKVHALNRGDDDDR